MFCEVQLCLEVVSIVGLSQAIFVHWSVNGGQEQIDCGRSHLGRVSEVLSGIHVY